jgi:hypothetical protein
MLSRGLHQLSRSKGCNVGGLPSRDGNVARLGLLAQALQKPGYEHGQIGLMIMSVSGAKKVFHGES